MQNPIDALTSLDELIWKQFEKITHYADKEFGLSKWDLARTSHTAFLLSGIIVSNSLLVEGYSFPATFVLPPFLSSYIIATSRCKERQKTENAFLRSGIVPTYETYQSRPLALGIISIIPSFLLAAYYLDLDFIPESARRISAFKTTEFFSVATSGYFRVAASYFEDQNPKPPTPRKPFFKTLYDKLNPFKNLEAPEAVPEKF